VLFLVLMSGSLNAKVLKNHRFKSEKDIKAALVHWLQQQARDFFMEGIYQFVLVRNLQIIIVIVCNTLFEGAESLRIVVNKVQYIMDLCLAVIF
jgi:hypothetical protein